MAEQQLPETMSIEEAAQHFGVSGETVRRWCRQGRLRSYKIAGRTSRVRVTVESVHRLVEELRRQASDAQTG